ncbi:MAG: dCTP deaminase [Oceanicoccus sp.]|jgi:dCTP deaminase
MILSDRDIKKKVADKTIVVTSPIGDHDKNIHGSSWDFRLGKHFKVYKKSKVAILDPLKMDTFEGLTKLYTIEEPGEPFVVHPGDFILGVTLEKVKLPADIVARVEGRSSLGRLGIIVHSTAGFIDAGFEGTITLEITNINNVPVALYPGMRVCQLAFETMSSPSEVPYGEKKSAKYQNQEMPQESKLTNDAELQGIVA